MIAHQWTDDGHGGLYRVVGLVVVLLIGGSAVLFVADLADVPPVALTPVLKAAMATVGGLGVLLAGYVCARRLQRTRRLQDSLDAYALTSFGLIAVVFGTVHGELSRTQGVGQVLASMRLGVSIIGLLALGAAALWGHRTVSGRIASGRHVLVTAGAVVVIALLGGLTFKLWGAGGVAAETASPSLLRLGYGLYALILFVVALLRLSRTRDQFSSYLVIGLALAAVGGVKHAMAPPITPHLLYVGDVFIIAGSVIVGLGAGRVFAEELRIEAAEARRRERVELAGEIHDGIAQDLALVTAQSRWLAGRSAHNNGDGDDESYELIATAAQRALEESRRTIRKLGDER